MTIGRALGRGRHFHSTHQQIFRYHMEFVVSSLFANKHSELPMASCIDPSCWKNSMCFSNLPHNHAIPSKNNKVVLPYEVKIHQFRTVVSLQA